MGKASARPAAAGPMHERKPPSLESVGPGGNVFAPGKLSRQTLNDQVYDGLKDAIMSGSLLPGTVLTIRDLARSFGVSMMPVREALSRLIAEKVLTFRPNRSVAVPVLTRGRFGQITKVRLLLEGAAAREGAMLISKSAVSEMEHLNAQMEASGPTEPKTFLDLNRRFHFTLYRAADQDVLVAIIESLWMQSGPILNYVLRGAEERNTRPEVHHRKLIGALKSRDADAAEAAIRADLESAAATIMPMMPDVDQDGAAPLTITS